MGLKKLMKNVPDEEVSNVIGDLKKEGAKVTKEKCSDGSWNLTVEYDETEVACSKPESLEPPWSESLEPPWEDDKA
jgi:hypothetical protein